MRAIVMLAGYPDDESGSVIRMEFTDEMFAEKDEVPLSFGRLMGIAMSYEGKVTYDE